MPLTPKGEKILAAMQEQYGEEEGKRIFYASKNAGTIEGVDSRRRRPPDDDDDDDDFDVEDSSTYQFVDREVICDAPITKRGGFLVANARIARTGIQLYAGDEVGRPDLSVVRVYRPPEEVFDKRAMRSMAHMPVTLHHPPNMVDKTNWDEHAVGNTSDPVARDGEYLRVPMMICDGKAIDAYEKHGIKELSVGYGCELKWGAGTTPDGESYDAKQTAIRGNHLAVVPAARGGSHLRIGDEEIGGPEMTKALIDGQTIEFKDELTAKHVQDHIASLQKTAADQKATAEEIEEKRKKVTAEKDALSGEVLALKKQLEDANAKSSGKALDALVNERTDLRMKADAVMDGKVDFNGKEPAEIRRTVVMSKLGDAAKDLSDAEIIGAFKAITADVKPRTGADRLADNLALLGTGGGADNSPRAIKDAAHAAYVKNLTSAWQQPSAQK